MAVQDRQMTTRFKSQIEKENLPLDKDWKKDLESHRPIDLLPDRQAETLASWMRDNPEIAVVSRDRASAYASAASEAAPHAVQVADRFHVCKNLTEATQLLLDRCQSEIAAAGKAHAMRNELLTSSEQR